MEITKTVGEPTPPADVLHKLVPVRRSELVSTLLLTLNVFLLLLCYYVLKVVREPMILLGGGAELKAYASAGQTLLLLAVVPAFSALANRTDRIRLLTIIQIIFIGCLVAFYALAQAHAPIGLAFYLWLGIFNVLVVSNFWSFANDLFSEEQGKRLFAIIGVGGSVGAIVGAFLPELLAKLLGDFELMLLAGGILGVSIVLYRIIDVRERSSIEAKRQAKKADEAPKGDRKGGFTLVMRDRYLRILAIMLLVATIINTTGEYVIGRMLSERAAIHALDAVATSHGATAPTPPDDPVQALKAAKKTMPPDDKALAEKTEGDYIKNFYSSYYGFVNLFSLLLQALVVARLLQKLGIRKTLFVMPVIVIAGWAAALVFATVGMMRIEKTAENSLDYSLHNTLRQALFLPTSRESKYKAKAAIDTFFFRMGDVIAGLGIVVLFVEVLHLSVRSFAIMNLVLGGVWLLLAARAGKLHDELVAKQDPDDADKRA